MSTADAANKTMQAAELKLGRFLSKTPAELGGRVFFRFGKDVLDALDSVVQSNVKPFSVLALCHVGRTLDHFWQYETHLKPTEKDWLRAEFPSPAAFYQHCERLAAKYRVDLKKVMSRSPVAPPPLYPSVVACRPADLITNPRPSAQYLRRCGVYVRNEVRRLLRAARLAAANDAESTLELVERAHKLDPLNEEVRRRRIEAQVRVGNVTGAVKDVGWWRKTYGDYAAEELLKVINAAIRAPKKNPERTRDTAAQQGAGAATRSGGRHGR